MLIIQWFQFADIICFSTNILKYEVFRHMIYIIQVVCFQELFIGLCIYLYFIIVA